MSFPEKLVRHAKLVLVIWVIATILMAPLALKLNEIVLYKETELLPEASEYKKVEELWKNLKVNYSGFSAVLAGDIIIVENMKFPEDGYSWYLEFKERALSEDLAKDVYSAYDIRDQTEENARENVTMMYNQMYNAAEMINNSLNDLVKNVTLLSESLWQMYNAMESLRSSLEVLIPVYNQTIDALEQAYNSTLMLQELLLNGSYALDENIENLTSSIKSLEALTIELKSGLLALDENYTELYATLKEVEDLEKMINNTISLLNSVIYKVTSLYNLIVFDTIRVHFYLMKATDAYITGLTNDDITKILYLTNCTQIAPISPPSADFIELVYYSVLNITYGNPQSANDTTLIFLGKNIAENIILQYNYSPETLALVKSVLDEYDKLFLESYYTWSNGSDTALLDTLVYIPRETPPVSSWQSQIALLGAIDSLGKNSIKMLSNSDVLISIIASQMPAGYADISTFIAGLILNSSVALGSNPHYNDVINATINVTKEITSYIGMSELSDDILRTLIVSGASPEMAYMIMRNTLTNETYIMLLDVVYTFDKNASGTLKVVGVLKSALLSVLESQIPKEIPEDLLISVVECAIGEISNDELLEISKSYAISMFKQMFTEQLVTYGFPEDLAETLSNDIAENYTLYLENSSFVVERAIYYVAAMAPSGISRDVLISALMDIMNGSDVREVAIQVVLGSPEVPEDVKPMLAQALRVLGSSPDETAVKNYIINVIVSSAPAEVPEFIVEDLNELYNKSILREDVLYIVVDDLVSIIPEEGKKLLDYIRVYGTNITRDELNTIIKDLLIVPEDAKSAFESLGINPEEFVKDIADNYTYNNIDVIEKYSKLVFNKIWETIFEDIHGILVSNDNRSFVIVLNTDSYEKAIRAYNIAKETLPEGANVHIFGEHIMNEELSSFGKKEASRIQLVSTLSVIIITIIVMESFLASVLPFIGIGTAITMSLATVYILGHLGLIDVSSYSRTLLITAPLGLGVDYATYMVRRFKIELANGVDYLKAVEIALRESFAGISASAFTDMAGFAVLALAWDFPFMKSLGLTLPIGVAYVYVSSLIVTPSILVLTKGRKWFWYPYDIEKTKKKLQSLRSIVVRRLSEPKVASALFIVIIALGAFMGYEAFTIERSHDYTVFLPINSKSYEAYNFYVSNYDIGSLIPIRVVVEFEDHWKNHVDVIRNLVEEIKNVENVAHVTSVLDNESYSSKNGKIVGIEITLSVNPLSLEGMKAVQSIRKIAHSYRTDDIKVYVGGEPEASKEIEDLLDSEFYGKVLPAAIILMFITLFLTYRSLPVTVIILSSLGISVFGGLAATKWVAEYMNIPIPWFLPIILVSVIIGVGIDYNSFYINRVRELMRTLNAKEAAERASAEFSLFIIGLSFIVASAFLSMLVSESWGIREIGIALSVAVLFSAALGAYLFLPVVSVLLGRKLWWPRKKF